MRGLVRREIARIQKRIREAKVQTAVATSGTPAALSGLYQAKVDESNPHTVPHEGVSKILKELSKLKPRTAAGSCPASALAAPKSSSPEPWSFPS